MTAPDPHGISPGGYLSTACRHGDHEKCRVTCKYCEAVCVCGCGRCGEPENVADLVEELRAKRAFWDEEVLISRVDVCPIPYCPKVSPNHKHTRGEIKRANEPRDERDASLTKHMGGGPLGDPPGPPTGEF